MERIAKELYDKLKLLKKENTNLYFEFFEEQNHGDALHLAVYSAFEKIFNKEKRQLTARKALNECDLKKYEYFQSLTMNFVMISKA